MLAVPLHGPQLSSTPNCVAADSDPLTSFFPPRSSRKGAAGLGVTKDHRLVAAFPLTEPYKRISHIRLFSTHSGPTG